MASKIQIAAFAGLLFYIVSNPITYTIVDSVFAMIGLKTAFGGKPNGSGLLIHSVVYAVIVYFLMKL